MKTLVTHKFPHLDDITAIWLWQKYVPGFKKAKVGFVELAGGGKAVTWKNKPVDSDREVIHFGVGRGKFDEHKGDIGKSATLLVHEYLLKQKLIPNKDKPALAKLIEFVNLQDNGKILGLQYGNMFIPRVLRNIYPSEKRHAIGAELLDAALPLYDNEALIEKDWAKSIEFETRWGKGLAIETNADGPDAVAYNKGFSLVIHLDPKRKWRMFRANADSDTDLTGIYEELHRMEPRASWFLHHSKHMLLCGSRSAPDVVRSRLSLKELVKIARGKL
ncbi:MAG: hypothetical protein WCJ29_04380 [bacterium]